MQFLPALLLAAMAGTVHAAGAPERFPTRPGISVSVYLEFVPEAKATVLLFAGGKGGMGRIEGGRPSSTNFLIRSVPHFVANDLNVAVFGLPSDETGLEPGYREGTEHITDIREVVAALRRRTGQRVWLVGTSRGTSSVAAAAVALPDAPIAGLVLTSSMTNFQATGAVANRDLSGIRVPVLVHHHGKDECHVTRPGEAPIIIEGLRHAPVRKLVIATDGANPSGDPCGALHWHGYIGMERQAVDEIAAFIRAEGR